MITQADMQRIRGRQVFIDADGRECLWDVNKADELRERQNGPHHDAKWARRLLGTDIPQSQVRRNRIVNQTFDLIDSILRETRR